MEIRVIHANLEERSARDRGAGAHAKRHAGCRGSRRNISQSRGGVEDRDSRAGISKMDRKASSAAASLIPDRDAVADGFVRVQDSVSIAARRGRIGEAVPREDR